MTENDQNIRVLIAEDDYFVSMMLRGLLEEMGYVVVGEASNGYEAIEMTHALKPSVVLMDIRMPEMNGIEAAQRIAQLCPTPVVIITAYDDQELVDQATTAGVGAYLMKPLNLLEARRAITIAIARFNDLNSLSQVNTELQSRNEALQAALEIKTLAGLLAICASCKKIRTEEGMWQEIEHFLHNRTDLKFSHGFCPECLDKLYPGLIDLDS